jgi:hypothetical protein
MRQRELDREILISCVLGDGCLVRHRIQGNVWISLKHCVAQKDYLLWKVGLIESTEFVKGRSFTVRYDKNRHRNGKFYPVYKAQMYGVKYFRVLRNWIYVDNKKSYKNVIQYLQTPLSLAIFFMDDGSVNRRKKKHRDGKIYFGIPTMRLGICKPIDECAILLSWIKDVFGINGYPVRHSRKDVPPKDEYYILNFDSSNSKRIWEYICPFVDRFDVARKKFDLLYERYPDITPQVARVPGPFDLIEGQEMVRHSEETLRASLNG